MSIKPEYISALILLSLLLVSPFSNGQQKIKLTATATKPNIAYVDPVRLLKEYSTQQAARKNLFQQWQTAEKEFKYNEDQQAKKIRQQLVNDSLQAAGKTREIQLEGQRVNDSLIASWKQAQQAFLDKRNKIAQTFQKNIDDAIKEVMREGRFTEVKTIKTGVAIINGKDITGLVLQKLH